MKGTVKATPSERTVSDENVRAPEMARIQTSDGLGSGFGCTHEVDEDEADELEVRDSETVSTETEQNLGWLTKSKKTYSDDFAHARDVATAVGGGKVAGDDKAHPAEIIQMEEGAGSATGFGGAPEDDELAACDNLETGELGAMGSKTAETEAEQWSGQVSKSKKAYSDGNALTRDAAAVLDCAKKLDFRVIAAMKAKLPDRDEALKKRQSLYFYKNKEIGKKFGFLASHKEIGDKSVPLGVYFESLWLFIEIAIVLSLVCIPNLVMNIRANNFASEFKVNASDTSWSCTFPWAKDTETSSFVTDMTLGNYCADSKFSSTFDCPAMCIVPPNTAKSCDFKFTNTTEEEEENGVEFCKLELDKSETKDIDVAQLILLLVGQMTFLGWMIKLRKRQKDAEDQINKDNITAGDYSVMIRGLDENKADNKKLIEFARHYGEVSNAFHITKVGRPIEMGQKLEDMELTLKELKKVNVSAKKQGGFHRLYACFYQCFLPIRGPDDICTFGLCCSDNTEKMKNKIEEACKKLESKEKEAQSKGTGYGIITYNYECHAKNFLEDHFLNWWQRVIKYSTFGLWIQSTAPKLDGQRIVAARAPEPSDLWWENTWVHFRSALLQRLLSFVVTFAVMAIGGVALFFLARENEQMRDHQVEMERISKSGPENDDSQNVSTLDSARLRGFSILSGLIVVIINLVITKIVNVFSYYERWATHTEHEKWLMAKLSIFYLMNSFLIPILAVGLIEDERDDWYSRGGVIEKAFYIQITNAIIPDVLTLLDPVEILNFCIISRFALTQEKLDKLMEPQTFPLAQRYASAVRTLGLAMLYAPALPISPLIASFGLLISYCIDKFVSLKRRQQPRQLNADVLKLVNKLLLLLPLAQMFLMFKLFFDDHFLAVPIFWIGFGIWGYYVGSIYMPRCKVKKKERFGNWGTENKSFIIELGKKPCPTKTAGIRVQRSEVYCPVFPQVCSDDFKKYVDDNFDLPRRPYSPIKWLMDGQNKDTGGKATEAPKR